VPPDVRTAYGFPARTLLIACEAAPRAVRRSLTKIKEDAARQGRALPHIGRQSRFVELTLIHAPHHSIPILHHQFHP